MNAYHPLMDQLRTASLSAPSREYATAVSVVGDFVVVIDRNVGHVRRRLSSSGTSGVAAVTLAFSLNTSVLRSPCFRQCTTVVRPSLSSLNIGGSFTSLQHDRHVSISRRARRVHNPDRDHVCNWSASPKTASFTAANRTGRLEVQDRVHHQLARLSSRSRTSRSQWCLLEESASFCSSTML